MPLPSAEIVKGLLDEEIKKDGEAIEAGRERNRVESVGTSTERLLKDGKYLQISERVRKLLVPFLGKVRKHRLLCGEAFPFGRLVELNKYASRGRIEGVTPETGVLAHITYGITDRDTICRLRTAVLTDGEELPEIVSGMRTAFESLGRFRDELMGDSDRYFHTINDLRRWRYDRGNDDEDSSALAVLSSLLRGEEVCKSDDGSTDKMFVSASIPKQFWTELVRPDRNPIAVSPHISAIGACRLSDFGDGGYGLEFGDVGKYTSRYFYDDEYGGYRWTIVVTSTAEAVSDGAYIDGENLFPLVKKDGAEGDSFGNRVQGTI